MMNTYASLISMYTYGFWNTPFQKDNLSLFHPTKHEANIHQNIHCYLIVPDTQVETVHNFCDI